MPIPLTIINDVQVYELQHVNPETAVAPAAQSRTRQHNGRKFHNNTHNKQQSATANPFSVGAAALVNSTRVLCHDFASGKGCTRKACKFSHISQNPNKASNVQAVPVHANAAQASAAAAPVFQTDIRANATPVPVQKKHTHRNAAPAPVVSAKAAAAAYAAAKAKAKEETEKQHAAAPRVSLVENFTDQVSSTTSVYSISKVVFAGAFKKTNAFAELEDISDDSDNSDEVVVQG